MKLEKWALIAEIVGGVAIVLSLIFVALEVQQGTVAQRAATYQEAYRDLRVIIETSPIAIQEKDERGEPFQELERQTYNRWLNLALRGFENLWEQRELGTIRDELLESYLGYMELIMRGPYAREWWHTRRVTKWTPEFEAYVDSYLNENPL